MLHLTRQRRGCHYAPQAASLPSATILREDSGHRERRMVQQIEACSARQSARPLALVSHPSSHARRQKWNYFLQCLSAI